LRRLKPVTPPSDAYTSPEAPIEPRLAIIIQNIFDRIVATIMKIMKK
jgi:hypothetical protein